MERSSDGSLPLKIVLAVIGVGTLLAFGYFFGNTQVMLIILGGIVAIALLLFLYRLVLRSGEARRARAATAEIAGATGKRPRELNDPAELAKVADLARKFEEGLEKFRTAGKDLYSIPWYVLVGEPGSGKTEALRHCGVPTPAGLAELPGVGGTINMNWWFTNQAIVLDTAGRLMFQSVEPGKSGEWTEFLKLLGRARPNVPINGLLLVIPADSLIRDSNNKIEEKAKKIALQFDLIQRTLGVRFPVFVLITKADLINGFREFFDTLDDPNTQHQMVGWSNPAPLDAPFDPDHIDRHLDSVRKRLLQYRAALMLDPVNTEDAAKRRADQADALYAFPDALTSIGPRLKLYMEMIFVQGEWSPKPLFLRGVYLTSAMREGSALDRELADLLGVPVDQLPEGKIWTRERPQFLKELFTKKVFRERGLVTRASNAAGLQRSRRLALFGGGLGAILALLVLTWLGYRQLTTNIVGQKDFWTALNKSYTDPKTVVDSRRRIDDKMNWSILGGAFDEVGGQELTNAYSFRGYRPILLGGTERPLGKVHSEAAERVRTEIKVPAVFRWAKFEGNLAADDRKKAYRTVYEETVLKPVVRAAADRMLTESAWTEETAPVSTRALMELIHLEVDAATAAIPAALGAGDGGMGITSPLNLDAIFTYVLTPGEYKKFADNEGTAFQTSLESLYASAAWPPNAIKGLTSKALSRGVDRFSEYWTAQATATGDKRQGPAPVMDLRRDALSLETALKELNALPGTAAQGPDTLVRYQELHGEWKTKLAALTKARDAVDRQVQAVEQRPGGWDRDDKLIDLYRAERAINATRARKAYMDLINEIPQGVPGPLLAIRNRLQKSMGVLPDPKQLAVEPEIETELDRLQQGLLAHEDERQPRVYQLCLASLQQADAQLPSPEADAAPAPGASGGEVESSADLGGPAGFVRRLERLPDALTLTDQAITTARQAALADLPAPNQPAAGNTAAPCDDVRNTVAWLLQRVAGPFQRYRVLNAAINGSGGGENAASVATAKQIGAVVAATARSTDKFVNDQFPQIPMTRRGQAPSKFVAEYDRNAGPTVIQAWLNIKRQFVTTTGKPRTDILELASLTKKHGEITEGSFGPYVGEYVKYWSDTLASADEFAPMAQWADYQQLLPSKAADVNEQLERLSTAVDEALRKFEKMPGAPDGWKLQSRISPSIAAARAGLASLELRTFRGQCTSALDAWSALGRDPSAGIKAARRLGVRKFHDAYMMPSSQPNPVASYWKNLTYKGLELLGTVESKGTAVDFTAERCFPLAPPKPGVNALDPAKLRDVRKKIVAVVGEEGTEPPPSAASAGEGLGAAYRKLYDVVAKKPIAPDEQWLEQGRRMIDALLQPGGLTVTISTLPLEAQKKNAAAVKPPADAVKGVLASEQVQLISIEGGEEPAPAFATSATTLLRNQPIAGKSDEAIQFHFQRQAMPDPADSRFDERVSGSWAGLKMLYPPYIAEQQDAEGKVWHVQLLPKDFDGQQRKYTVWVELKFDKPLVRFPSEGQAPPAAAAAR